MNENAKAAAFRMRRAAEHIIAMLDTLEGDPEPTLAIEQLSAQGIATERAFRDLRDELASDSHASSR